LDRNKVVSLDRFVFVFLKKKSKIKNQNDFVSLTDCLLTDLTDCFLTKNFKITSYQNGVDELTDLTNFVG